MQGLFRRRRDSSGEGDGASSTVVASPQDLRALRDQINELEVANRADRAADRDRAILWGRHRAGIALIDGAPSAPAFASSDDNSIPGGSPLPEFAIDELNPHSMRAAILRDGCVLVRGVISPERAASLVQGIDRACERRAEHTSGENPRDGFYEEFGPDERFPAVFGREWTEAQGVLGADSPALMFDFFEVLRDTKIDRLASAYLGEPAVTSVQKTTFRVAVPSVPGGWHQDGKFMGPVRSLNLWLALSRCGDVAPGLDIVPKRLDDYVVTGTEGAGLDWTISDEQARQAAGAAGVIRPIFQPGDALFFDEMLLHKTGSEPSMPNTRYAIENWFFGGSSFPADYAPIAV